MVEDAVPAAAEVADNTIRGITVKQVSGILLAVLIANSLAISAFALSYTPVEDNAEILSEDTLDYIGKANESLQRSLAAAIFVVTVAESAVEAFALERLHELKSDAGLNGTDNCMLLLIGTDGAILAADRYVAVDYAGVVEEYFQPYYEDGKLDYAVQSTVGRIAQLYGARKPRVTAVKFELEVETATKIQLIGFAVLLFCVYIAVRRRRVFMLSPNFHPRGKSKPSILPFFPIAFRFSRYYVPKHMRKNLQEQFNEDSTKIKIRRKP
ncbi:MAG: TPM domain-containing protein [Oscillospiraceae bacterium]|nr:TPM domain-containing protein [Oscillospiraceae bacterium]